MATLCQVHAVLPMFGGELRLVETPVAPARYVAMRGSWVFPLVGGELDTEIAPKAIAIMCSRLKIPKSLLNGAIAGQDVAAQWQDYLATHDHAVSSSATASDLTFEN